ncbi:MAG: hypothetical protein ABEJ68_07800 [Halobacteriaceae archaeon]
MSAIPGDVDADRQPPMAVPLRHFVVALAFLLAGGASGVLAAAGALPGRGALAHVHLLLAGWVCITIMGAMTQFVPVWSGVELHSKRLARAQLVLVAGGLAAFVAALLANATAWFPAAGFVVLVGFWTFVYNVGRTLAPARPWDVTERHFALALAFFIVVTALGLLLAAGLARPSLSFPAGVTQVDLRAAHATLAVFGAVLTTVLGALYQLATMFTQSDLDRWDRPFALVEQVGYPVGVVAFAGGRLLDAPTLARFGGVLVAAGLAAFAVVLARRLLDARVDWTPMLTRYGVAALATAAWAPLAARAWLADPFGPLFGPPAGVHLLFLGVVGMVVLGTLYHVVPFVVWVHRYSDRLGLEPVPMIDDLYDSRVAAVDALLTVGGGLFLVAGQWRGVTTLVQAGGVLATLGFVAFAANLAFVVHAHGPDSLLRVVFGARVAGEK